MSEHTPGPWRVDPKKSLRVVAGNDDTVATSGLQSDLRSQWEANARLIATAPDYDAAARKSRWAIEYFINTYGPDPAGMALNALNSIDCAIAKAEGKST